MTTRKGFWIDYDAVKGSWFLASGETEYRTEDESTEIGSMKTWVDLTRSTMGVEAAVPYYDDVFRLTVDNGQMPWRVLANMVVAAWNTEDDE